MIRRSFFPALLMIAVVLLAASQAQDSQGDVPRALLSVPLGAIPGESAKVTIRGLLLEGATEARSSDERLTVKLLSQGKAEVPANQNPQKVGDSQVELEIAAPADVPASDVEITIVTPKGEAKYRLPVGGEYPICLEKEPNGGFQQPQAIGLPQIVLGRIESGGDVDVFSIEAQAGQKIVCRIAAEKHGSALDGLLTIYDAAGRILATCDDVADGRDPRLEFRPSAAGKYLIVVQDAHDQGGPAHPYRLTVQAVQ